MNIPPLVPTKAKYNKPPRPTATRDYGRRHQLLRKLKLEMFPVCQRCNNAWAVEAHHLVYPATSLDDYEALCSKCHDEIHN